jgi:hypothetical protein
MLHVQTYDLANLDYITTLEETQKSERFSYSLFSLPPLHFNSYQNFFFRQFMFNLQCLKNIMYKHVQDMIVMVMMMITATA